MLRAAIRDYLRPVVRLFGCELVKLERCHDPFGDIRSFQSIKNPVVFDVGGNEGQTVRSFEKNLPHAIIYSFEPSPASFEKLKTASRSKTISFWNLALGSTCGQKTFLENTLSEMSSFLPLGERGWGKVEKETLVMVTTVDQFCAEHHIDYIDVLKTDTQGYDLEVFKGATGMLEKGKVGMIFFEVNFSEMYKGAPHFEETFHFLNQHGYYLEHLYGIAHLNQAIWTDALFVHKKFLTSKSIL